MTNLPPQSAEERSDSALCARLLDHVRQAVVATDRSGRVVYWNHFAEQLYGWPAGEAIGRNIFDLTTAPRLSEVDSLLERIGRGESWSGEFNARDRSGRVFPVFLTESPLFDDHGVLIGIIGVANDISDVKAARDALYTQQEQLVSAQRLAHIGTIDRNYQTGEEVWSGEIYRIFEISPSVQAHVDLLLGMVHPDDRAAIQQSRRRAVDDRQPFEQVFRVVLSSGSEKWIRTFGQITFDSDKPAHLFAAVQDVTSVRRSETDLRRHAMQQAALTRIGQIALNNASLRFIFAQAAASICDTLNADLCNIYKSDEGLLRVGASGPREIVGETIIRVVTDPQAAYTMNVRGPVIVSNAQGETRFKPSPGMLDAGMLSGLSVIIDDGGEQPWGVIGAYFRTRREFNGSEIDFVRAMATTLGQAIENRHAEVELRVRAIQQSAIAEFGHRLLMTDVDQETLERGCELVMDGLSVEFSVFLQSDDNGLSLWARAGHHWLTTESLIRPMYAPQAVHTLATGLPVVVDDYFAEERFDTSMFVPFDIRSGITVPVIGPKQKFGVLTAQTRASKQFSAGDMHFMESLASVLADALTRETATRDLVDSEQRFRSVVEGASEIIFSLSPNGKVTSINPAFEAITGWRCEEWIGRRFDGLIDPGQLDEMRALFTSIMSEPRSIRVEAHMRGKDGNAILVDAAVTPKIVRGAIVQLYGFARDVTEERRLEGERNRVTRQLQLILESIAEGIYATDVRGRCTLVNRSAAKLLAASPDWLIGTDIHALVHPRSPDAAPDQTEECPLLEIVRSAESHSSGDDIFCRADGSPFPVEYTASPMIDRGEVIGTVVAFNDLSARRKLESKLEQANRLSSLGRLAATVAHEFNNVLMGISPFAEVLRRETLTDRGQKATDQISRSVKRGKRITEDILRFTQPSEPVLAGFDAAAWLHTIAFEARSLIGAKYTVDVEAPTPEPVRVIGDASQLHQSFINLILNARDAMPDGGRIGISVNPARAESRFEFGALERPERYAHFIVEDSGYGMSPETLRHIFEPLFTTKKNGTGLGLPVARHVVTRHGGEIFVESTLGAGTKFHLFIPLAEQWDQRPAPVVRDAAPSGSRRYRRVLVVEDERPVATGIAALLELEGIGTKIVENGRDVLPAIADWHPEAIVLDIGLPDMDGTRVFASIARKYPEMPVVFSSGHGDESQLEEHLARPNVAFLLKPYDVDTLLATLDRVVT